MADKTELLQAIDDAILDADSLEQFINGSEEETVLTRLSAEYPTLQKALKELFENGGIPATPFKTKVLMEASSLPDDSYAVVTDDTDNIGLYVKTAGAWVLSSYNPELKAIDFFKKSADLYLVPNDGTRINYDIATKTLSFVGLVRLVNGSTILNVSTPSSITFPSNGLYRIVYDHSTQSLDFDVYSAPPKSDQSFVAICDVATASFVAYGIPHYTVNGKANAVKTEGSYYGNVTTNWIYSSITIGGSLTGIGEKRRLLSEIVPLKGVINAESSDPNIRVGLMVYNKDGSANRLVTRSSAISEKVDGYFRAIISYEDSSDLELTDANKVSIVTRADIPDEMMKHTETIPKLELGGISYISGQTVSATAAFRTVDFIKMSGAVSVKPIAKLSKLL